MDTNPPQVYLSRPSAETPRWGSHCFFRSIMAEAPQVKIDPRLIAEAKIRAPLSSIVGRYVSLKRAGGEYQGLCPFHKEKSPSFTVNDRKNFYHCFGCGQHGDAISIVMTLGQKTFNESVADLLNCDIESAAARFERELRGAAAIARVHYEDRDEIDDDALERGRRARSIWTSRLPLKRTLAERYLMEHRALTPPWPDCVGFLPALYFAPLRVDAPAMIAALTNSKGEVTAVQATFLDAATGNKIEPRKEAKRTIGQMLMSSIKLMKPSKILGIAEGFETGLSAQRRHKLPVWVTCGALRMKKIEIPDTVEDVMLFRDTGDIGLKEAIAAAELFEEYGRKVWIEAPTGGFDDFNSMLQAQAGKK